MGTVSAARVEMRERIYEATRARGRLMTPTRGRDKLRLSGALRLGALRARAGRAGYLLVKRRKASALKLRGSPADDYERQVHRVGSKIT